MNGRHTNQCRCRRYARTEMTSRAADPTWPPSLGSLSTASASERGARDDIASEWRYASTIHQAAKSGRKRREQRAVRVSLLRHVTPPKEQVERTLASRQRVFGRPTYSRKYHVVPELPSGSHSVRNSLHTRNSRASSPPCRVMVGRFHTLRSRRPVTTVPSTP